MLKEAAQHTSSIIFSLYFFLVLILKNYCAYIRKMNTTATTGTLGKKRACTKTCKKVFSQRWANGEGNGANPPSISTIYTQAAHGAVEHFSLFNAFKIQQSHYVHTLVFCSLSNQAATAGIKDTNLS